MALQLISKDDAGKYWVSKEAKNFLESIHESFSTVGVVGAYRTGKSTLLNILQGDNVFGTCATTNACTKGVYVAPRLIEHEGKLVLLVDSEGLGSSSATESHDLNIYCLGLLLSTSFVYNTNGAVNDDSIGKLNLVINCAKQLIKKEQGAEEELMPAFTYLSRDFSLNMVDNEGKEINGNQYFEQCLQPTGNDTEKDAIRQSIRDMFPNRGFTGLVRPVNDENDLASVSEMYAFGTLRPEFMEQMNKFKKKIFDNCRLVSINGRTIDGPMYVKLVEQYCKALNSGVLPELKSTWAMLAKDKNRSVLQECIQSFDDNLRTTFKKYSGFSFSNTLSSALQDIQTNALDVYRKGRFFSKDDPFEIELKNFMEKKVSIRLQQHREKMENTIKTTIEKLLIPLQTRVSDETYRSLKAFQQDYDLASEGFQQAMEQEIEGLNETHFTHLKGIWYAKTQSYFSDTLNKIASIEANEKLTTVTEEHTSLKRKFTEFQSDYDEVQTKCQKLEEESLMYADERASLERHILSKDKLYDDLKQDFDLYKDSTTAEMEDYQKELQETIAPMMAAKTRLQAENKTLQLKVKHVEEQSLTQVARLESALKTSQEHLTKMNEEIQVSNTAREKTENTLQEVRHTVRELSSKLQMTQSTLESTVSLCDSKIEHEKSSSKRKIDDLLEELGRKKAKMSRMKTELATAKEAEMKLRFSESSCKDLQAQFDDLKQSRSTLQAEVDRLKKENRLGLSKLEMKYIRQINELESKINEFE